MAFKASPSSQHQHCTDEAQKAETVLSAVSYIYIYIYTYIYLTVILRGRAGYELIYITNEAVGRVGYYQLISGKSEKNNCFSKFSSNSLDFFGRNLLKS